MAIINDKLYPAFIQPNCSLIFPKNFPWRTSNVFTPNQFFLELLKNHILSNVIWLAENKKLTDIIGFYNSQNNWLILLVLSTNYKLIVDALLGKSERQLILGSKIFTLKFHF